VRPKVDGSAQGLCFDLYDTVYYQCISPASALAVLGLSLGGSRVVVGLGGGIEPERLHVSYYELYYHRVREIRR